MSKIRTEEFEGAFNVLGNGPDFSTHRHEIVIILPPRHDVKVEMVGDSGAGDCAEIETDVESLGLEMAAENRAAGGEQGHEMPVFRIVQIGEISQMTPGSKQQVAIGVRKTVE